MIKISVIVPVYNTEKFLVRCLNSLVNQTYQNLEIIIVNDGSIDGSQAIIDEFVRDYPSKIVAFFQQNSGQSVARNLALEYISGGYITFVDSDDWLEIDAIESLHNAIVSGSSEIAVCDINLYWQDIPEKSNFLEVFKRNKFIAQKFICGKIFAADFWAKHNFRFIENIFYEDLELVPKILFSTNKISLCNKYLYNYELRNSTSTTKIKKRNKYIFFIFDNLVNFYNDKPYNILYEKFLLTMMLSIFLEEFGGENKDKVNHVFVKHRQIVKLVNCSDTNQKFITICIKLKLPLSLVYTIVNIRRYLKNIYN